MAETKSEVICLDEELQLNVVHSSCTGVPKKSQCHCNFSVGITINKCILTGSIYSSATTTLLLIFLINLSGLFSNNPAAIQ